MNSDVTMDEIESLIEESTGIEFKVNVLYEMLEKLFDKNTLNGRSAKFKLLKYLSSDKVNERLYGINVICSDGKSLIDIPSDSELEEAYVETKNIIVEEISRRYVQSKLENEVEKILNEKQDKYIDEIKLQIIKKNKGPENTKTLKKYAQLEMLNKKKLNKSIQSILRPQSFDEIVGQDRPIKALISKLISKYPQHILIYGPPGVGKTSAARIALEEAKKFNFTPFNEKSKFVEVNGTTLRWDPREVTNPLLGSVHDPIYQGSKKDLADIGIPEPKPGLVTEAHGGILFIDEIGELDLILQNKLLKVLEDKKVEFSSAYYDPDDENIPKYIKYLFNNGAPADFILIGATTKEPHEINPALRSRCTEVFFEPLSSNDIETIVNNASKKLNLSLEDGVCDIISEHCIEGRKAINIMSDAYGYALYKNGNNLNDNSSILITKDMIKNVLSLSRVTPFIKKISNNDPQIGLVKGLGVSGFIGSILDFECETFKSKKESKGKFRFNETAGSMAKDSVFNASTVIRKLTGIDLNDYDIHLNAVGGGKIDGPSAGAAITICILSSLLNKPIPQDISITGEISIKGKIKKVGGIFEKIYAARRKGLKYVIIPKENENDIPMNIDDIKIICAKDIIDVIKFVFKDTSFIK